MKLALAGARGSAAEQAVEPRTPGFRFWLWLGFGFRTRLRLRYWIWFWIRSGLGCGFGLWRGRGLGFCHWFRHDGLLGDRFGECHGMLQCLAGLLLVLRSRAFLFDPHQLLLTAPLGETLEVSADGGAHRIELAFLPHLEARSRRARRLLPESVAGRYRGVAKAAIQMTASSPPNKPSPRTSAAPTCLNPGRRTFARWLGELSQAITTCRGVVVPQPAT